MVAAAVGMQVRGWVPFASTFAAFLSRAYDFIRMAAISRADIRSVRLARRRLDRRGRAVADGARGHRVVPRDPRLDRAAPVRRQPDGEARRRDGRQRRASRSSARCAARPTVRTPRRTRTCAIGGSPLVREGDDVAIVACGITRRPGGRGGRDGSPATASRRACSTATRSSRSTPRPCAPPRASAARSSRSRTTGPRAGWATRCSRRWPRADDAAPVRKLAVREMPTSGTPDELLHAAGIDADGIAGPRRALRRERVAD